MWSTCSRPVGRARWSSPFATISGQKRPVDNSCARQRCGSCRRKWRWTPSSTRAVFVLDLERLLHAARPALGGLFPCLPGIVHPQRHVANAVAVQADVLRDLVVRPQRCGQHKADLALLQNVGGTVALARLGARVGHQAQAQGHPIKVGGLACIADIKLDVIGAVQREKIFSPGQASD